MRGPVPLEPHHQPCCTHTNRLPHCSCLSSVASVFSAVQKTPLTRDIAGADIGLESPSCVNAECRRGDLHPSPPAPLPFQGRGVLCAISTAAEKHKILPSPPERGRGAGGEGASLPGTRPPAAPQTQTRLQLCRCLSSVVSVFSVANKTPRTRDVAVRISGWKARAA